MKRQTIYKGVTIQTEIIFNYRVERCLNGKKWHKVGVKIISDKANEQFVSSDEIMLPIENTTILSLCEYHENKAKDFIDNIEQVSQFEQFFINNGFSKNSFGK